MFTGAINQDVRAILAETGRYWIDREVYVGCSGNFTVERVLANIGVKRLHSNDVSLYSCALGKYLVGEKLEVRVMDEKLKWLEEYLEPGIPTIATLALCTQLLSFTDRDEPYFKRMFNAYVRKWDELHAKTMDRIQQCLDGVEIEEFYAGDVIDFLSNAPDDAVVVTFPPTYKGGYERLYKKFDEVFDWEKPQYEIFDDERFNLLMELVTDRDDWMTLRDKEQPDWEEYLKGVVQTSLRSKPVYVYAKTAKSRIAMTRPKTEPLLIQRLGENEDIKPQLTVIRISQPQMNLLRSEYLSKTIIPASASINLGVLANGKLIGAIAFNPASYSNSVGEVYLLSDFCIRPTKYKRLSKLILAATLSMEVKQILEQTFNRQVKKIYTTAFTEKAVSMKYRGLYEIENRKQGFVNYFADAGRWTLKEGLDWWMEKYAE